MLAANPSTGLSALQSALAAPPRRVRHLHRTPLNPPEQFNQTYAPGQDVTLSKIFGIPVKVFARGPGHMSLGYADPFDRNKLAINLSAPMYKQLYTLTQPGMHQTVTPLEAKATWTLAHELGHIYSRNPRSELQANNWGARHFKGYLQRMGVHKPQRLQLYHYARERGLV